jgi:diguanylate cyclase (GGDEF)-like protein/PAS domain S-box-containing protein
LLHDGEVTAANAAFANVAQFLPEFRVGRNIRDFLDAHDTVVFEAQLMATVAVPGVTRIAQVFLRTNNGSSWNVVIELVTSINGAALPNTVLARFIPADTHPVGTAPEASFERPWDFALIASRTAVWDHDLEREKTFYSNIWREIRGLSATDTVPQSLDELLEQIHPDDKQTVLNGIQEQRRGDLSPCVFQYRYKHRQGHWIWIECRGGCVKWDDNNRPLRVVGTDTDITTRKNSEETLERISQRLKLALEVSKIGVFEADFDLGSAEWDAGMFRLYNIEHQSEVKIGGLWESMLHPEDMERVFKKVDHHVANLIPFSDEYRVIFQDGSEHFIRSRTLPFIDNDGHRKMIGANWDVTADLALQRDLVHAKRLAEARNAELESAKKHIEYVALHDPLTGLPNRRYLEEKIISIEADCRATGAGVAVLHFDLDRFKQINDTYGHHAGDVLLQHTAKMLKESVRSDEFVARLGGDEFVAIVRFDGSVERIQAISTSIIEALRKPQDIDGIECRSGTSIGIACEIGCDVDVRRLLVNADIALYQAKEHGRNRFDFFSNETRSRVVTAKHISDEILVGLERDEFIPVYQPQFDAVTLDIVGVEALVRWQHPTRGLLAPGEFLGIAEEMNIVGDIDHLIFRKAMSDAEIWATNGVFIPKCSVNVSARRLQDPKLKMLLDIEPEMARRFSFELLESIFLDELDGQMEENLAHIRRLGISIEVDDFGTAHASIMSLLHLRPSTLKIDRRLIHSIDTSPEQKELVGSIIGMGHSLGVKATAEGVETACHATILRDLGCDILQGFGLAKPMFSSKLIEFVRHRAVGDMAKSALPT